MRSEKDAEEEAKCYEDGQKKEDKETNGDPKNWI
jgi:hypothetical protein